MRNKKGKTVGKSDLPEKSCRVCGKPFSWRKKWAEVWDQVQYCSDRCRRNRGRVKTRESDLQDIDFTKLLAEDR